MSLWKTYRSESFWRDICDNWDNKLKFIIVLEWGRIPKSWSLLQWKALYQVGVKVREAVGTWRFKVNSLIQVDVKSAWIKSFNRSLSSLNLWLRDPSYSNKWVKWCSWPFPSRSSSRRVFTVRTLINHPGFSYSPERPTAPLVWNFFEGFIKSSRTYFSLAWVRF